MSTNQIKQAIEMISDETNKLKEEGIDAEMSFSYSTSTDSILVASMVLDGPSELLTLSVDNFLAELRDFLDVTTKKRISEKRLKLSDLIAQRESLNRQIAEFGGEQIINN